MRPDDVLGEAVPINFVLARTPRAAVTVQHITAYPTGFEFDVVVAARIEGEIWDPMHGLGGFRGRPGQPGGEMADEILRFGIQYADGSKATSLGPPMIGPQDKRPEGPILQHQGGGGGGTVMTQRFWAWPLPPPGPLAFVCEWPKYGVPLTRHEIVNLGGAQTTSLRELIGLVEEALGARAELDMQPDQKGDMPLTSADVSHAGAVLGYAPSTPMRQGLKKFAEWIRGEGRDWV